MTRPTDAAIARAFYDAMQLSAERAPQYQVAYNYIIDRAAEFDAESPAGMSKSAPEVTANSERVQIPAESKHVQCPKCPAHMPVGLYCGGAQCPLRK